MLQLHARFLLQRPAAARPAPRACCPVPTAAPATAAAVGRRAPSQTRLQATTPGGEASRDADSSAYSSKAAASSNQQEAGQPQADVSLPQPAAGQSDSQPGVQEPPAAQQAAAQPSSSPVTPAGDTSGSAVGGSLGGVQESSGAGSAVVGGGGAGGGGGPSAVTLLSRFNGVGYTFVLAGFLKIMTVGGLTLSAPTDVARTAFGKATPYLMVPVGLAMCWAAKQIVDTGLNESKRFLQYLVAGMVVAYFALVKLMYKYEPQTDWVRRPRPRMPGQMAELRSQLGDRELLAAGDMDSARFYEAEKPGSRELYDDVAWYEGRYPSQLAAPGQQQSKRGTARRAALAVTDTEEEYSMSAANDGRPRFRTGGAAEPPSGATARRSFLSDSNR